MTNPADAALNGTRVVTGAQSAVEWPSRSGMAPRLVLAALEFAVLIGVMVQLDLLTPGYRRLLLLALTAFIPVQFIHARLRMPAFALLSAGGLVLVMGGSSSGWDVWQGVVRAVPILTSAAVLGAIVMLPAGFWQRAGLLVAAGAVLAAFRAGYVGPERLAVVWPVLASLVMFRVILLLYTVATEKKRPGAAAVLGYLVMVPNAANSIFPLVDFNAFTRATSGEERSGLVRRGVTWIRRGVGQLVLYRFVHQLVALPPGLVADGTDVAAFILGSTFAYLQVSGLFHLATGVLLLFGFNLPETNKRYFLASSFTDYWRRVNIYWKDFILKVFYYPTYFRLKGRGATVALVVATLWSFFVTWALHLYQTWWLKGAVSVTGPDAAFWSILGLLVLANSLWEQRRGRVRKRLDGRYAAQDAAGVLLRTGGTFLCIALLWSLWNTQTFAEWAAVMRHADWRTGAWLGAAVFGVMTAALLLEIQPPGVRHALAAMAGFRQRRLVVPAVLGLAPLLVVVALADRRLYWRFETPTLQPIADALRTRDSLPGNPELPTGGYYERLTAVDPANRQLWEALLSRPLPSPAYTGAWFVREVDDLRGMEALPNIRATAFDTEIHTNEYGLRDGTSPRERVPGTNRIAVLGSSHVMGWGIKAAESFPSILEERLNTGSPSAPPLSVEVINFAFPSMSPVRQIDEWVRRAAHFKPDVGLVIAHPKDRSWLVEEVPAFLRGGQEIRHPYLIDLLHRARVTRRTPKIFAEERVGRFDVELMRWTYAVLGGRIAAAGAIPVAAIVPLPEDLPIDEDAWEMQVRALTDGGFRVYPLRSVFEGYSPEDLALPGDPGMHSNQLAHRLVAPALEEALRSDATVFDGDKRVVVESGGYRQSISGRTHEQ